MSKVRIDIERARFYALAAYIVLVFLMGGGSRDDIQSLIVLRPLAVLMCGFGFATLAWRDVRRQRAWLVLAGLTVLLPLLHLIPLPPALWQALPGREVVAQIDAAAGLEGAWRPISLVPFRTWNAFFALLVPLAVLLVGAPMSVRDRARLMPLVLAMGMASALLGLLQAIGPGSSLLYLYRITNDDAAVGLFANRNHQAFLLATVSPLLVAWSVRPGSTPQQLKARAAAAIGAGVLLIPMILVTGSRAGLLLSLFGGTLAALIYRRSKVAATRRSGSARDWRLPIAAACLVLLGIATILASRAEAIQRLLTVGLDEDLRFAVLPLLLELSWLYFPVGSGLGTFVEVFRQHEPDWHLVPQYLNHAHNDLIELVLTAGLPGLVLLGGWIVVISRSAWHVWRTRQTREIGAETPLLYGRCASVGIAILLLASLSDYPLRTPSLAMLFVLFLMWLRDATALEAATSGSARASRRGRGRAQEQEH